MRAGLAAVSALALGLAGGAALVSDSSFAGGGSAVSASRRVPVTLREAVAVSRRLGPLPPGRTVEVELALRPRHGKALLRLLSSGEASGPVDYAKEYGPNPGLVRLALSAARRAGLRTEWVVGEGTASLEGAARVVEGFFRVHLLRYVAPGDRTFFAPDRNPVLPLQLRRVVDGVAGLDDFAELTVAAIPLGGMRPRDVMSFYDIAPLRASGLTGAGVTVVFPEINSPADIPQIRSDVAAFSGMNGLPAVDLSFRTEPAWGATVKGAPIAAQALGEADLDVEIVHSVAPGAKLIVYEEPQTLSEIGAFEAMVKENPTAIISDSVLQCELALGARVRNGRQGADRG